MPTHNVASLVAGLVVLLTTTGCAVNESFAGRDVDEVWTALVAVAETPDYDHAEPDRRWTVQENEVWVAPDQGRIEVFRRLKRHLRLPGHRPRTEHRTWRFQIRFKARALSARFAARGWDIPGHVQLEAERYFDDVHRLLEPLSSAEPVTVEAPQPAIDLEPTEMTPPPPDPAVEPPAIDVDSLLEPEKSV